jgi:membrane protease YdiL (CAAX protease family)
MALGFGLAVGLLFAFNLAFFDLPLHSASIDSLNNEGNNLLAVKILQITSQFGLFIIPAFAFSFLTNSDTLKGLSFSRFQSLKPLTIVFAATLLAIPFVNLLAEWNANWHLPDFLQHLEAWMRKMQDTNDRVLEYILIMETPTDIGLNILMMAILPAIGEELLFRGVIQKQLVKWLDSPHLAIFITSFIFSAFHMQFLGFLSRLILGMIFGYLFYYSKNIWTAITAHLINNSLALVIALIYGAELSDIAMSNTSDLSTIIITILGFIGSIFLLIKYRHVLTNN